MLLRVVVARACKLPQRLVHDVNSECPNTLVESLLDLVFNLVGFDRCITQLIRVTGILAASSPGKPRKEVVLRQGVDIRKWNERLTVGHGNTTGAQPKDRAPAGPGCARWPQFRIPGRCAGVPKEPGPHPWAASTPPPEGHDDPQWGGPGAVPPADE